MAGYKKLRYEQQVVRSPNRFSKAIVSIPSIRFIRTTLDENLGSLRKFTPLCFVRQSRDLWSACVLASLFGEQAPWPKSDAKTPPWAIRGSILRPSVWASIRVIRGLIWKLNNDPAVSTTRLFGLMLVDHQLCRL